MGWQMEHVVGVGREVCVGFIPGDSAEYIAALECMAAASQWVQCAKFHFKRKSIWIKGCNSSHLASSIFFERHRFIQQFFTFFKFTRR